MYITIINNNIKWWNDTSTFLIVHHPNNCSVEYSIVITYQLIIHCRYIFQNTNVLNICSYYYNKSEQINNICVYLKILMYTKYAVITTIRVCKLLMDRKYSVITTKRVSKLIIYHEYMCILNN